jgi:hypothetical protein
VRPGLIACRVGQVDIDATIGCNESEAPSMGAASRVCPTQWETPAHSKLIAETRPRQ